MPTQVLEIHHRTTGQLPPKDEDTLLLQVLEENINLGELIRRTVEEEIRILTSKQKLQQPEVQRVLASRYLSRTEVLAQAEQGKVSLPRISNIEPTDNEPKLRPDVEVKKALQAFERKEYVVLLNGQQLESLEEPLSFNQQNTVIFLRLMPLVGG